MGDKGILLPKTKFKSYIKALFDFDNLMNDYYKKVKEKKPELIKDNGYLINKKQFDKLKEELSYSKFKKHINEESKFNEMLNEKYGNASHITYIPIEQKIFNSSKNLLSNLCQEQEYVIVNKEIWKKFNNGRYKENEGIISYEINENIIVINLDGEKTYFKYNLNIIKYGDLLSRTGHEGVKISKYNGSISFSHRYPNINFDINKVIESEEKLLEKLYSSLIEYNNFEKFLINKLKEKNKDNNDDKLIEGYFIEKYWFQKWKHYTDYDNNKYLLNDLIENKDKIKNNIKYFMFFIFTKSQIILFYLDRKNYILYYTIIKFITNIKIFVNRYCY